MFIVHHGDNDGKCAAFWAARLARPDGFPTRTYSAEHDNGDRELSSAFVKKGETVVILDFSLTPDTMREFISVAGSVIWIDHHKSAIEEFSSEIEILGKIKGVRVVGLAGCELSYLYFKNWDKPQAFWDSAKTETLMAMRGEIPLATRIVGDNDVGDWILPNSVEFMLGSSIEDTRITTDMCRGSDGLTRCFWYGVHYTNTPAGETLNSIPKLLHKCIENGKVVKAYSDRQNAITLKKFSFEVQFPTKAFGELRTLMVNNHKAGSAMFSTVKETDIYDMFVTFYYNGTNYTMSFFQGNSQRKLDVSVVAKELGGGGHVGAAGAEVDDLEFCDIK